MIVSAEQTQIAARYVGRPARRPRGVTAEVPPELMERIVSVIAAAPELRADRITDALVRLEFAPPSSDQIADMIIARAICDGLR